VKKTIDKEIDELIDEIDFQGDVHPAYLSTELRTLQVRVISAHARLENSLETRIVYQFAKENNFNAFQSSLSDILSDYISFRNKIEIVKEYNDNFPIEILLKVNTYRNEFAHPDGTKLRKEYNRSTPSGKINIRNLLRCLKLANEKVDIYAERIYLNNNLI